MRPSVAVLVVVAACASPPVRRAVHHGPPDVRVELDVSSFQNSHYGYDLYARPGGGYDVGDRIVDAKAIADIDAALTDLHEADGIHECVSHTDDYRDYRISIRGAHPLELWSHSNCTHDIPWHVIRDGKLYIQYTGALGRAIERLFAAIDPGHYFIPTEGAPFGDVLFGQYSDGTGGVGPDLPGITVAPSIVKSCGQSIEASHELAAWLGQPLHVTLMLMTCRLADSPDCRRTNANTSFSWNAIDAQIDLTCVDGVLELSPANHAMIEQLSRFVASRPATLLASHLGRLSLIPGAGTWVLSADDPKEVELTWTPPADTMEAQSFGDGPTGMWFWNALGLDATSRTRETMVGHQTIGTLDFAGHAP